MSDAKGKIAVLRTALALMEPAGERVPLGMAQVDGCLAGGLKRGALHEIFAVPSHEAAAAGFVTGLAVRLGGPLLWVQQDYSTLEHGALAATGFVELGFDPVRLILVRAPDATGVLRAAGDALSCAALGTVVIELTGTPKQLDLVACRRLALGAGQSGVTALLLRFAAEAGLGAGETRWQIRSAPSGDARPVFDVELQRNRHGAGGHWVMEWCYDDGVFRAADRGVVVCPPADRPAAAAMVA